MYFRNLHADLQYPQGTVLQNPKRVVEYPTQGIESMDVKDFAERVRVVFKLTNNAIDKYSSPATLY